MSEIPGMPDFWEFMDNNSEWEWDLDDNGGDPVKEGPHGEPRMNEADVPNESGIPDAIFHRYNKILSTAFNGNIALVRQTINGEEVGVIVAAHHGDFDVIPLAVIQPSQLDQFRTSAELDSSDHVSEIKVNGEKANYLWW